MAPVGELPDPFHSALTRLFEVRDSRAGTPAPGSAGSSVRRGERGAPVVKVIPLPRANNISIMLTQFSAFDSPLAIRDAVLSGSSQLGLEHLSLLLQIAPTMDEAKALKMYRGPFAELSPPEQFLRVMADVPRLVNKVQALIFIRQFGGLCREAREGMETLQQACEQVRQSSRLRRVLATILAAGNQLNAGTARGGAGGLKLESLLKLNDVKVTAGPAGATPRLGTGDSQQPPPQQQQQPPANGIGAGPDAEAAAPLPVKTLLEFVAWVAMEQEAAAIASASSGGTSSSNGGGQSVSGSGRGASSDQALALAVRSGFLAQQLPELARAVRRMQTDVADSMRGLESGMKNLQQELEFEHEQALLKGGSRAAPERQGGSSLGAQPAGRQAAFSAELEAAAGGGQAGTPPQGHQHNGAAGGGAGQAAQPPFAAMLEQFLEEASGKRDELDGVGAATSAAVRATVAWLGEPAGSEQELTAALELLFNFCAAFDLCCRRVHRLMQAAAAS